MSSPNQCNMLDLSDDCFYHIYEFLPIIDWCSLRETCTRFRTISDYCFHRRSGTFELKHVSDIRPTDRRYASLDLSKVKRVLRTFGGYLKTLSINQNHFNSIPDCNVLMLFLERYCRSLVDLELIKFDLTVATIVQCSRLFSNLQRLVIDEWDDEEAFSCCLTTCVSLRELEFIDSGIDGDSLTHSRIESLKSFTISDCPHISNEWVKRFLTVNCQLTQVKLFRLPFEYDHNAESIIEDVANTLPKIEALSLILEKDFLPNVLPVTKMTSLKKLEINLRHVANNIVDQLVRGLAEHNNIEDLHLAQFECTDESIGLLSSIKRLSILKLTDASHLNGNFCKKLVTGLSDLDEIHIVECKDTSFNDMKEIVLHNPNLRRIVFNRPNKAGPSIAAEALLSLVEIRKSKASKKVLLIHLNDSDLRDIKKEFKSREMGDILTKNTNVLSVLQLDKDNRRTVSEYGSGSTDLRQIFIVGSDEEFEDEPPSGCLNGYRRSGWTCGTDDLYRAHSIQKKRKKCIVGNKRARIIYPIKIR